jgi:hypothetical protein
VESGILCSIRRYRLTVRTEPSQGLNTGSIPVSATTFSIIYRDLATTGDHAIQSSIRPKVLVVGIVESELQLKTKDGTQPSMLSAIPGANTSGNSCEDRPNCMAWPAPHQCPGYSSPR